MERFVTLFLLGFFEGIYIISNGSNFLINHSNIWKGIAAQVYCDPPTSKC